MKSIARVGGVDKCRAKVEGDGAPHINRSVEAKAIPVAGDGLSPGNCRIASPGLLRRYRCSGRERAASILTAAVADGVMDRVSRLSRFLGSLFPGLAIAAGSIRKTRR